MKKNKTNFENKFQENFKIFLKGFLMGICDIIPGISGGTIAFITGIYIRLINSIKNINLTNILKLLKSFLKKNKKEFKKNYQKQDLTFLITIILGILTAIILTSNIIKYLLENYKSLTLAFFLGLIIASSKQILKQIPKHTTKNKSFTIIGFLFGISLFFIQTKQITNPTYLKILFSGIISVSALFLPGISGSFILMIIGTYDFILNAITQIKQNINYLLTFATGAIFGAIFISQIITYLYKKDKSKTLYTLFGLVLGTLIIPIKQIIINTNINILNFSKIIILFLLGILIVEFILKLEK